MPPEKQQVTIAVIGALAVVLAAVAANIDKLEHLLHPDTSSPLTKPPLQTDQNVQKPLVQRDLTTKPPVAGVDQRPHPIAPPRVTEPPTPPPPSPEPSPLLLLQDIRQEHNGKPFNAEWRFEVYVGETKIADIPTHNFASDQKTVPVGPGQSIGWSPATLAGTGPNEIKVVGYHHTDTLPSVQGTADIANVSGATADVTVEGKYPTFGKFHFEFMLERRKDSKN